MNPIAETGWREHAWLRNIENAVVRLCELGAAVVVAVEIGLLLWAVFARYVIHHPLLGADELASMLLLWTAMLGSVVALRRGDHMRMSTFVGALPPRWRVMAEEFTAVTTFLLLLVMCWPAAAYVQDELGTVTMDLELSSLWRTLALVVGFLLMVLLSATRLIQSGHRTGCLILLIFLLAIGAGLYAASPLFARAGQYNLLIFFVGILPACIFSGLPIAFSFAAATFGYLVIATEVPIQTMVGRMAEGMSQLILLAVPMFVFLGYLIEMTGIARKIVGLLIGMFGHLRGGLSYVLIAAMYLVSGISGSKAADMAAVAPVLFPEMKERGARPGDLVALLAATGAQTETVPPSLVLITIGSVTGVSIGALFSGGLLPSLVLAITLCSVVAYRYRKEDLSSIVRPSGAQLQSLLLAGLPGIILPFVIRGAVVEGIATATEVSTIGIAYAALVGLLTREFKWRRVVPMLVDTAALSAAILLIVGVATSMAWALTQSGFSASLANTMKALSGGATAFLLISAVTFVLLGSILEGIPAVVLFAPLLFPIAKQLGVNEVHYSMVVVLAMGIGLFCPPFGVGYYVACAIGRVDPTEGLRPIAGYVAAMMLGLLIVTLVPWISTCFLQ